MDTCKCRICGCPDLTFGANAYWDPEAQDWTYDRDESDPYCPDCGTDTEAEWESSEEREEPA